MALMTPSRPSGDVGALLRRDHRAGAPHPVTGSVQALPLRPLTQLSAEAPGGL